MSINLIRQWFLCLINVSITTHTGDTFAPESVGQYLRQVETFDVNAIDLVTYCPFKNEASFSDIFYMHNGIS